MRRGTSFSAVLPWDPAPVLARVSTDFGGIRLAQRYELLAENHAAGRLQVITQAGDVRVPALPEALEAREAVLSRLELVGGIGPVTAARLRAAGVRSVEQLRQTHPHGERADEVCQEWDTGDLLAICDRLRLRLAGRGHLLAALVAGCVEISEIAFFDVETLGLAGNTIFLCGLGRFRDGAFVVEQYLAPGYADEPAMLSRAVRELSDARVVITYNGRTADVPWMRTRCFFHGLSPFPELAHLDLVFGTRRRFVRDEQTLANARLPTVQHDLLGLTRPSYDVPSSFVPDLYQEYVRTGCEGLLVPILDHNRSDLEALVRLLELLCAEALAWCR
jgi:uncharacterized protein YprB with RNaseH-like and TPR domain